MLIFYILLFFLALWGIKFSGKGYYAEESLSRSVTDSVKGVFIWLVFLSHFSGYATYTSRLDTLGKWIPLQLGQLIVALFLFYSGYGVCEAIKKKGSSYVKPFPKNRIGKTLIHFDIAVLLFLIIALATGEKPSLTRVALSFVGWDNLGNSNWYIFDVLVLYAITWISFTIIRKNNRIALLLATTLTLGFIIVLRYTRWSWWYDTVLCYILGMWFSFYKEKVLRFLTKNNLLWCGTALVTLVLFEILHFGSFGLSGLILKPLVFCILVITILIKFNISNTALVLSGQYTFELYILQRIPMILLKHFGLADFNIYIYFISCIVITIALAFIFRKLTNLIDKLLFNKKAL